MMASNAGRAAGGCAAKAFRFSLHECFTLVRTAASRRRLARRKMKTKKAASAGCGGIMSSSSLAVLTTTATTTHDRRTDWHSTVGGCCSVDPAAMCSYRRSAAVAVGLECVLFRLVPRFRFDVVVFTFYGSVKMSSLF